MRKRGAAKQPTNMSTPGQERPPEPLPNGTHQLIATKAYELYEHRGREHGYALDDWLTAEAIVNGQERVHQESVRRPLDGGS